MALASPRSLSLQPRPARLRAQAGITHSSGGDRDPSPLPSGRAAPGQGGAALWAGRAPPSAGHLPSPALAGSGRQGRPGRSPPVPQGTAGWGPSPRAVCEDTRQGRRQDTPVRAGRLLSPPQLPHLREDLRSLRPLSRSYTAKWRLWGRAVPAPPPAPSPPRPGPRAPLPAGRGAAPGSRQGRAGGQRLPG